MLTISVSCADESLGFGDDRDFAGPRPLTRGLAPPPRETSEPSNEMSTTHAVVRARGVFGFFSGAAPSISRSFIVSGSRFVAFAGGMRFFVFFFTTNRVDVFMAFRIRPSSSAVGARPFSPRVREPVTSEPGAEY